MKPVAGPSLPDRCEVVGIRDGRKVWRDPDQARFHTWEGLHGEVEVFNLRGRHLGAMHPITGVLIKEAKESEEDRCPTKLIVGPAASLI